MSTTHYTLQGHVTLAVGRTAAADGGVQRLLQATHTLLRSRWWRAMAPGDGVTAITLHELDGGGAPHVHIALDGTALGDHTHQREVRAALAAEWRACVGSRRAWVSCWQTRAPIDGRDA